MTRPGSASGAGAAGDDRVPPLARGDRRRRGRGASGRPWWTGPAAGWWWPGRWWRCRRTPGWTRRRRSRRPPPRPPPPPRRARPPPITGRRPHPRYGRYGPPTPVGHGDVHPGRAVLEHPPPHLLQGQLDHDRARWAPPPAAGRSRPRTTCPAAGGWTPTSPAPAAGCPGGWPAPPRWPRRRCGPRPGARRPRDRPWFWMPMTPVRVPARRSTSASTSDSHTMRQSPRHHLNVRSPMAAPPAAAARADGDLGRGRHGRTRTSGVCSSSLPWGLRRMTWPTMSSSMPGEAPMISKLP